MDLRTMTVGDLRKLIRGLPDDTPLVERRWSDYGPVNDGTISVETAYRRDNGSWYMRWHPTTPATDTPVKVLYYSGN